MAITEVFCAPVKPGSTPEEQVQILRSQAPVGNISWGYVIDEPPTLQAFIGEYPRILLMRYLPFAHAFQYIDWDSLEAHSIFNASDVFPELMQGFQSMFAGIPSLSHVEFKPSPEAQEKVCNVSLRTAHYILYTISEALKLCAGSRKGLAKFCPA